MSVVFVKLECDNFKKNSGSEDVTCKHTGRQTGVARRIYSLCTHQRLWNSCQDNKIFFESSDKKKKTYLERPEDIHNDTWRQSKNTRRLISEDKNVKTRFFNGIKTNEPQDVRPTADPEALGTQKAACDVTLPLWFVKHLRAYKLLESSCAHWCYTQSL